MNWKIAYGTEYFNTSLKIFPPPPEVKKTSWGTPISLEFTQDELDRPGIKKLEIHGQWVWVSECLTCAEMTSFINDRYIRLPKGVAIENNGVVVIATPCPEHWIGMWHDQIEALQEICAVEIKVYPIMGIHISTDYPELVEILQEEGLVLTSSVEGRRNPYYEIGIKVGSESIALEWLEMSEMPYRIKKRKKSRVSIIEERIKGELNETHKAW